MLTPNTCWCHNHKVLIFELYNSVTAYCIQIYFRPVLISPLQELIILHSLKFALTRLSYCKEVIKFVQYSIRPLTIERKGGGGERSENKTGLNIFMCTLMQTYKLISTILFWTWPTSCLTKYLWVDLMNDQIKYFFKPF